MKELLSSVLRPLYSFRLFKCRQFPLAAGKWLAAMQCQFPKVFFKDAAASSLAPPHWIQHVIRTVGLPATAKFL
jgi:hypothetical protein